MSWHRADSKQRASLQHSGSPRISTAWVAGDGGRSGHATAGEARRLLRGVHRERGGIGALCSRETLLQRYHVGEKLMDDAAKAAAPIPNATILEDDDRARAGTAPLDDAHDLQRMQLSTLCSWQEIAKVSRHGDN